MSIKKQFIIIATAVAIVSATAAKADNPDIMTAPKPIESYFYVEANIGYAHQDYTHQAANRLTVKRTAKPTAGSQGHDVRGGSVYGVDLGFLFNQYIGFEFGWTDLPRSVETIPFGAVLVGFPTGFEVRNAGAVWAVFKLVAPLTKKLNAFFKAGVSYKYGDLIFQNVNSVSIDDLRPVFGAGAAFHFAQKWIASLSWMRFMGGTSYSPFSYSASVSVVTPASDIVMFSLGYKLPV